MFSKEERKAFHTEFWTAFGIYMRKHKPTAARQWLNYRTNIPDMYFRMEATHQFARVSIDLQMRDDDIREVFWEQWQELKRVFSDTCGDHWKWDELVEAPDGRLISRIGVEIPDVNIYNKSDWGKAFQFFEKHMVPLDEFWADFNEIFKTLL